MRPWIEASWPAPPGVSAITTTRVGAGVSQPPFAAFNMGLRSGDERAAVLENRRQLQHMLALPSAPHWLRQVHGVQVAQIAAAASDDGNEPEADAAVTAKRGQVLAILTADCLPVVLAARDGSEIAAAHAGWRGLAAGILECTIATMQTAPPTPARLAETGGQRPALRNRRGSARGLYRPQCSRCGLFCRHPPRSLESGFVRLGTPTPDCLRHERRCDLRRRTLHHWGAPHVLLLPPRWPYRTHGYPGMDALNIAPA